MLIRPEQPSDHDAIREVNRLAFGQDAEGRLVDRLRESGLARLSLVAEDDAVVVGHILFSNLPIHTTNGIVNALALATMAVVPARQKQGIGSKLVREGIRLLSEQGHRIVIVLGHKEYYPRFGFSPELARPLQSPYAGEHFMALELVPGSLAGIEGAVKYPPQFDEF